MTRTQQDQKPLGELLLSARLNKGLSRAQVSKATGINEGSLSRYERAGIDDDGQYPLSRKLALLCFFLEIPHLEAAFSCLDQEAFESYRGKTWEDELLDHPAHNYLLEEYTAVLRDCRLLRAALRSFYPDQLGSDATETSDVAWVRENALRIFEKQESFEAEMIARGSFVPLDYSFSWPGNSDDTQEPNQSQYSAHQPTQRATREGGPDRKDPNRPVAISQPSNAVLAATDKPKKGPTDG